MSTLNATGLQFWKSTTAWSLVERNYALCPGATALSGNFEVNATATIGLIAGWGGLASAVRWTRTVAGATRLSARADYPLNTVIAVTIKVRSSSSLGAVGVNLRPNVGASTGQVAGATVTIPAGESEIRFTATSPSVASNGVGSGVAFVHSSGVIGDTMDITGIQVELGTDTGPYFDGDTPDTSSQRYSWEGAVGASTSIWETGAPTGSWITLTKGNKGTTGVTGAAGASLTPVKSLTSRNLTVPGLPTTLPSGQWLHFTNNGARADEVNPPATVNGELWTLNALGAYLVTVYLQINPVATVSNLMTIVKLRADGSAEEVRRTIGIQEDSVTVTAVFLHTNPTDQLLIQGWMAQAVTTYGARMTIAPIGPLDMAPDLVNHQDYTSAGTRVTDYSIAVLSDSTIQPIAAVPGDWMYLVHMHFRETADITPTVPAGWTPVVTPQVSGTVAGGIQWFVWRKKRVAGETSYAVNLSTARFVRASIIVVRQPNDDMPVLSAFTAPRAGLNPSVITVPGGVPIKQGGLVIAIAVSNPAAAITPPPTMTGAVHWFSVPNVASTNYFAIATKSYPAAQNTDPVVFTWTTADQGRIGGVALNF